MLVSLGLFLHPWLWIVGGGVVLTAGDVLMRFWIANHSTTLFVFGFFLYVVGVFALAMSYVGEQIAEATFSIVLVNVITLLFVSYFIFAELPSRPALIGMVLGAIALVMMEFYP